MFLNFGKARPPPESLLKSNGDQGRDCASPRHTAGTGRPREKRFLGHSAGTEHVLPKNTRCSHGLHTNSTHPSKGGPPRTPWRRSARKKRESSFAGRGGALRPPPGVRKDPRGSRLTVNADTTPPKRGVPGALVVCRPKRRLPNPRPSSRPGRGAGASAGEALPVNRRAGRKRPLAQAVAASGNGTMAGPKLTRSAMRFRCSSAKWP